jgi:hypothetical protein
MHSHALHLSIARLGPVACPDCREPAEVLDSFSLGASDGPSHHLKIRCTAGHWYTLPADRVEAYAAKPVDLAA